MDNTIFIVLSTLSESEAQQVKVVDFVVLIPFVF